MWMAARSPVLIKPTILIQSEEEERNFPGLNDTIRNSFGG